MKPISLAVAELKPALVGLAKVISRRSTLPVLGHIRLERTTTGIELAGTDLDSTIIARLTGAGEPRTVLVPFEDLQNIVKGCGREDTVLVSSFDKSKLAIRYSVAGNAIDHHCETLPVDEFPPVPSIEGEPVSLDDGIRASILQALECASTDETRAILNGVYIDVSKPGAHHVIATDGRRLYSSNSFALPLKESVLIPSHRFLSWKPFTQDGDWTLRVALPPKDGPQHLEIASTHWRLIARVQEGNYPNWRQVVPDCGSFKTKLVIDSAEVDEIIKTIAQLPDHDAVNHVIGLESAGSVRLLARSSATEEYMPVPLTGVTTTGKDIRVFLNRNFLTKALRFGLNTIELSDPLSPIGFSNGGRQMIVMPTRPSDQPFKPTAAPAASTTPPPAEKEAPMAENGNTNGSNVAQDKPALETALTQVESIRGEFRAALTGLGKLADTLKAAQREHKASDKEVASVRQTLRSLQSVKL